MNKLKKIFVVTGTTMLGMAVLTGCGTNNSSSTETTQTTPRTKPSYDTNGLSEKVVGNVAFYTSKKDEWKDNSKDNKVMLELRNTENDESITFGVAEREFDGVEKSVETLKAELEKGGSTNIQISKTTLNKKETIKISYESKGTRGIQQYVALDKTHVGTITYNKGTEKNTTATLEKEVIHMANTVELV